MADGQEIYIRNPLAVLNVDLCGIQALRLFTLDPAERSASYPSAGERKVIGSLSKFTSTPANRLVIPLSSVKTTTTCVGPAWECVTVINKHVHYECTNSTLLLTCEEQQDIIDPL